MPSRPAGPWDGDGASIASGPCGRLAPQGGFRWSQTRMTVRAGPNDWGPLALAPAWDRCLRWVVAGLRRPRKTPAEETDMTFIGKMLSLVACATTVLAASPGWAATFKVAVGDAQGGTQWELATRFQQLFAQKTAGRHKVDLFPNGALGSEEDTVNNAAMGTLDFSVLAVNNLTPFSPSVGVLTLPYVIHSAEEARTLTTGEVGKALAADTLRDARAGDAAVGPGRAEDPGAQERDHDRQLQGLGHQRHAHGLVGNLHGPAAARGRWPGQPLCDHRRHAVQSGAEVRHQHPLRVLAGAADRQRGRLQEAGAGRAKGHSGGRGRGFRTQPRLAAGGRGPHPPGTGRQGHADQRSGRWREGVDGQGDARGLAEVPRQHRRQGPARPGAARAGALKPCLPALPVPRRCHDLRPRIAPAPGHDRNAAVRAAACRLCDAAVRANPGAPVLWPLHRLERGAVDLYVRVVRLPGRRGGGPDVGAQPCELPFQVAAPGRGQGHAGPVGSAVGGLQPLLRLAGLGLHLQPHEPLLEVADPGHSHEVAVPGPADCLRADGRARAGQSLPDGHRGPATAGPGDQRAAGPAAEGTGRTGAGREPLRPCLCIGRDGGVGRPGHHHSAVDTDGDLRHLGAGHGGAATGGGAVRRLCAGLDTQAVRGRRGPGAGHGRRPGLHEPCGLAAPGLPGSDGSLVPAGHRQGAARRSLVVAGPADHSGRDLCRLFHAHGVGRGRHLLYLVRGPVHPSRAAPGGAAAVAAHDHVDHGPGAAHPVHGHGLRPPAGGGADSRHGRAGHPVGDGQRLPDLDGADRAAAVRGHVHGDAGGHHDPGARAAAHHVHGGRRSDPRGHRRDLRAVHRLPDAAAGREPVRGVRHRGRAGGAHRRARAALHPGLRGRGLSDRLRAATGAVAARQAGLLNCRCTAGGGAWRRPLDLTIAAAWF
ncbi:hypothetical protein FQR65_LT20758 [Abscondita terminalis]|nr:hypothetical protein FQR65_LT20758 [Abscondita terminalis]